MREAARVPCVGFPGGARPCIAWKEAGLRELVMLFARRQRDKLPNTRGPHRHECACQHPGARPGGPRQAARAGQPGQASQGRQARQGRAAREGSPEKGGQAGGQGGPARAGRQGRTGRPGRAGCLGRQARVGRGWGHPAYVQTPCASARKHLTVSRAGLLSPLSGVRTGAAFVVARQ